MKIYEVGGAIRDELMGIESKDVDFAVEAESFELMSEELKKKGFHIFLSTPEYLTIRAQVPKDSPLYKRTKVADFVLCRKDSASGDGRRPDFVEPGTILDDLARRDFTMNAIARDPVSGELIDPYGGVRDIKSKLLKFVGNPLDRIREDGLRVLRGYRFMITKNMLSEEQTEYALVSDLAREMLGKVSVERIREELAKMFSANSVESIMLLSELPSSIQEAIFRDGLWLQPTMKER